MAPQQYPVSLLHHEAVKRALSSALAVTQPLTVQFAAVCVAAISPLTVMEEIDIAFSTACQRLAVALAPGPHPWQVRRAFTHLDLKAAAQMETSAAPCERAS